MAVRRKKENAESEIEDLFLSFNRYQAQEKGNLGRTQIHFLLIGACQPEADRLSDSKKEKRIRPSLTKFPFSFS